MFQDTPQGTTHSYNDGCGEVAHNQPLPTTDEWGEFDKKFPWLKRYHILPPIGGIPPIVVQDGDSEIKKFITTHFLPISKVREVIEDTQLSTLGLLNRSVQQIRDDLFFQKGWESFRTKIKNNLGL